MSQHVTDQRKSTPTSAPLAAFRAPAPVGGDQTALLLHLQRTIGNAAVTRLLHARDSRLLGAGPSLQRQKDETSAQDESSLSPEEAETFESVMNDLLDEELDAAFTMDGGKNAATESTESVPAQTRRSLTPTPTTVQRVKTKKAGPSIASSNPDLALANRLEGNRANKPRLVTLKRWRAIKKKHAQGGVRKYAAIVHRNLQNDAGTSDLVLLLRLHRLAKIGKSRDRHYAAIEAKANKKGQTPQNRTELLGEAVTAIRMENYLGGGSKLLVGYASGAGIDQLWVNPANKVYYVVEAKGPNATLKDDKFAVRGAGAGATLKQMSQAWVEDRIARLKTSYPEVLKELLNDCALQVKKAGASRYTLTREAGKTPTHTVEGLVITAAWDATNGDIKSGLSKPKYTF